GQGTGVRKLLDPGNARLDTNDDQKYQPGKHRCGPQPTRCRSSLRVSFRQRCSLKTLGEELFTDITTLLAARRDGKYCRTNRSGPQVEVIRGSQPVLNRRILLSHVALERNEDQSRCGGPWYTVHLVARGGRLFIIVETTTDHGLIWVVRTRTAQMSNIGDHRKPGRAQCLKIR